MAHLIIILKNITANDNVENGNVVYVDFGRKAAAPIAQAD